MNYSLHEYATHILLAIQYLCQEFDVPEPNIISESGRALTAHHAVLIADISDIEIINKTPSLPQITDDDSYVIRDIYDTYQSITKSSSIEIYNYA